MTRLELLQTLIRQARANGFEFRKWYVTKLGLPWVSFDAATEVLAAERRYYALIFSHEFAQSFWNAGDKITFVVPNTTFTRRKKDGTFMEVTRKAFTRRSGRTGVWRYHLQQLSLAEEPLRHLRRYLIAEEHLANDGLLSEEESEGTPAVPPVAKKAAKASRKVLSL
jgi:hypothetical protein